jgi:rhodanese-related sulfurtransferase
MENNYMRIRIFFIVALLLTSVAAWAQNYNIPDLTVDEVKKQLDQPGKVLLVDTRTEEEYRLAHIRTAVNIPPSQFKSIGNHLPKDKSLPIIFYCRGYS